MDPDPSAQAQRANRQIARAAGTLMVTFVLAKLIGLAASQLLARAFGTQGLVDAYYAGNRFSETLFNLVAGGALASAFIPTFTAHLAQEDRAAAWRLASAVANLVLLALTVLGALGWVFAPWVVANLLGRGFDPAQQALTVELLRIQLPSAVIFGISGLIMGVLNAHQSFLFPALAPALYPLGVIFGVEALAPRFGIHGVAWGVVIGALLHLLVQVPRLARLPGIRYTGGLGLGAPAVREVLLLMGPRLIGVAVVQLNFWINTVIASGQPDGSIAAISWGFMLMMMPQAAIAQSIAIAALPTFSAQVARGRREEMRGSLAISLRGVLLMAVPASIGMILLRQPLVAMIYERGAFTAHSTNMVAWALLWYAAGLVGHCVVEIVSRAFYALRDTRTPVILGVAAMTLNIVFSLVFSGWFARVGLMPHGGLALANSLATALEMIALLVAMIYERGAFTAHSTSMVAWALLWYSAGLVGHCVVEIVSRAFYALRDTRTPVILGVAAMTLNIVFSLAFSAWFARVGLMPHGGLALANSLATALEMIALLVVMRRRLGGLQGGSILRAAWAATACAAAMAAVLWLWLRFTPALPAVLLAAGGIALGGLAYGGLLIALRVSETRLVWGWVASRLRR